MATTKNLRDDHKLILDMLTCFETALARAHQARSLGAHAFAPFVEFFHDFADRWHHVKEEQSLFPALVRAGLPAEMGPVGCMLEEHRAGRACLGALQEALAIADDDARHAMDIIQREGGAYIDLLRDHIAKENGVLFEMADGIIHGAEEARVLNELRALETEAEYAELARHGRALATQLQRIYL